MVLSRWLLSKNFDIRKGNSFWSLGESWKKGRIRHCLGNDFLKSIFDLGPQLLFSWGSVLFSTFLS